MQLRVLRIQPSLLKEQKGSKLPLPVTCVVYIEDLAVCIMMQHAAYNRPRVLNSGYQALDQSVPQWHILPTVVVPV